MFTLTSVSDYFVAENGYFFCTVPHSFIDTSSGLRFMESNTSQGQVCPYFYYMSDATITATDDPIPPTMTSLTVAGTHLQTSASGAFTTTRVDALFQVVDVNGTQACGTDNLKYPSVYFHTITDNAITGSFDMGICNTGILIANLTLTRDQAGAY